MILDKWQKFQKFFWDQLKLLLAFLEGLLSLTSLFAKLLAKFAKKVNIYEYFFLFLLTGSAYLFSRGFLGYELNLGSQKTLYHTIVSDDFFWFSLFHFIAFLPLVVEILYPVCNSLEFRLAFGLRIFGLLGISILYLLSWINPQRIAPVKEAQFTIWFYFFGLNLLALWAGGILGMVRYAQRSHNTL